MSEHEPAHETADEAGRFDDALIQRTYTAVLQHFVDTGRAPHYTALAARFGVSTEQARLTLAETARRGFGCWMIDGTDYVGSFAPFYNTPTQYEVTVDGEQRWWAQCGLETFAVRWMFPGKEVQVDIRDLATTEPIRLRFRDEELLEVTPDTTVGYFNTPMWKWGQVDNTAHL
ncbi:MAG: organomercurial lyase [Desertimonas sp.]